MRFRWRCRPLVESIDRRCLLSSSSIFSGFPGVSLFSGLFPKKKLPPSIIEGQATAGPARGEINLVTGSGMLEPFGKVTVPGITQPSHVFDISPQGTIGTMPFLNRRNVYSATVTFTAPNGATLTGTRQILKYTETRYWHHGAGVHEKTVGHNVDAGRASLSFPNGLPVPGGPAVHYNLVMTSTVHH
jgi:hypothetical protein